MVPASVPRITVAMLLRVWPGPVSSSSGAAARWRRPSAKRTGLTRWRAQ